MKTIEEREEICAKRELPHNNGTIQWRDGYREGLKVGYHFGATEQKAIDIENALDIFDSFLNFLKSHNMTHEACEKNRIIFRKAMEE